jgi:hypothetical protein
MCLYGIPNIRRLVSEKIRCQVFVCLNEIYTSFFKSFSFIVFSGHFGKNLQKVTVLEALKTISDMYISQGFFPAPMRGDRCEKIGQ